MARTNLYCAFGHPMRHDPVRSRMVCDTCEGTGRKPRRSGKPSTEQPEKPRGPRAAVLKESPPTEETIQKGVVGDLRKAGYKVFVNTTRLRGKQVVCKKCGFGWFEKPDQHTGQTPGIPDLDVFNPAWKHPLLPATPWIGIEMKSSTGSCTEAQAELRDGGHTVVARSAETALAVPRQTDLFFARQATVETLLVELEKLAPGSMPPKINDLMGQIRTLTQQAIQAKPQLPKKDQPR